MAATLAKSAKRSAHDASLTPTSRWLHAGSSSGALFPEQGSGIGHVEDGEVQAAVRIAFVAFLHLLGYKFRARFSKVFDGSHADMRLEDNRQQTVLIDVEDQQAIRFA